jgi:glutaredoxin 3
MRPEATLIRHVCYTAPMATQTPTPVVDIEGTRLDLTLYMFTGCPYCRRVTDAAAALGLSLETRNIRADPAALADLLRVGGKKTVPCLFVNGRPLYESEDIVRFLKTQVRPAANH